MKKPYQQKEKSCPHAYPMTKIVFITLLYFAQQVIAEELLRSDTAWDGSSIVYPAGEPEITSAILRLDEGVTTQYHCHPVPALGYILKGNIEVERIDGQKIMFREGESAIEVMKTLHRGRAVGGPVEVIVFYAGAKNTPNTVYADDKAAKDYCN